MSAPSPASATTPRIEVVRGGQLGAEELAALVVALAAGGRDATGPEPETSRETGPAAWTRAALREGVGAAVADRPSDLTDHGWASPAEFVRS